MKKQYSLGLLAVVLFSLGTQAQAGRLANQERRIDKGVQQGRVSGKEEQALREEHAAIVNARQEARADGRITAEERAALQQSLHNASKHIYEDKHNVDAVNSGQ